MSSKEKMAPNPSLFCPACLSINKVSSQTVDDYEYRIPFKALYTSCGGCHTAYQTPMPDMATLATFYPANYHSQTHKGFLNRLKNQLRASRLLKLAPKGLPILDYGCGDGAFLMDAAKKMPGVPLFGYEIAREKTIKHLNNNQITLIQGSFEDLLEILPACGLITMNHVIEHLPEPSSIISRLCQKLAKNGVLEGQTPAAGCFEQSVFKERWSGYHAPRHTVIFSQKGLRIFLEHSGLHQIKIRGAFNPAAIAVSLASSLSSPSKGIERNGFTWLFWVGGATLLAPFDLLSGKPGIINFSAVKKEG